MHNADGDSDGDGGDSDGDSDGDGDADGDDHNSVVGAWYVNTSNIEVGWTLCEDNRMYGFTTIEGFSFLDKGTWSGTSEINIRWNSKDTTIGEVWGEESGQFSYDVADDSLCCWDSTPMRRLEGEIDNSDCDPGW